MKKSVNKYISVLCVLLCMCFMLTSCSDLISIFGEGTTAPIETTEAPETTKEPETTEAPDTTEVPETTVAPDTTEVPETTVAPEETTVPPEETTAPPEDVPTTPKKRIAFTFDDGPHYKTTPLFLDKIEELGIKATFFIAGYKAVLNGADTYIKRMAELGCEIGNHTYSHTLFYNLSEDKIVEEVESVNSLIENATGIRPTLLRPPYGEITRDMSIKLGMHIIHWSIDPEDWLYKDAQKVADHIIAKAKDGDIILLHDIYQTTYEAFCIAAEALIADGFELVTVSELLDLNDETLASGVLHKSVTNKK